MDTLVLALRAIWWRRGASVAVLLIAVFGTSMAAAGPVYLAAAEDSILGYSLRTAPATASGTGVEVTRGVAGPASPDALLATVDDALRGDTLRRAYPEAIGALYYPTRVLDANGLATVQVTVAYRAGACAQVRLLAGRCVDDRAADEVMITPLTARKRHWEVGREIGVDHFQVPTGPDATTTRTVRIVGVFTPVDPDGGYWFNDVRHYFAAPADHLADPASPDVEALLVSKAGFAPLSGTVAGAVTAVADLPFHRTARHLADVTRLRTQLDAFGTRLAHSGPGQRGFDGGVDTGLRTVLDRVDTGRRGMRVSMLLVVGQLLLLGWYVLFMVATGVAEARAGEVALAKLRGLPAGTTVAFGLVESVLLLALAVPLGIAVGVGAVHLLAGSAFGPGATIAVSTWAWFAAVVAAAGGLLAAAAGGVTTLRRPILQQWRRASREVGARSVAVDAAIVVLAAAALAELWWRGSLGGSRPDALALAAPALLALAGGLAGARLLPVLARALQPPTRGSRRVGLFVALRQVARRPGGARLVAVLATAFGLATFSAVGASVFAANRHDRAATETGAARLVTVDPAGGPDLRQVVRRLDPDGHWAMAALNVPSVVGATSSDPNSDAGPSREPLRLLAVQADRLAAVGYWRPDFARRPLAEVARAVAAPVPTPMLIHGGQLRLTGANKLDSPGRVTVYADLTRMDGQLVTVAFGGLDPPGAVAIPVPCADSPCQLRRIYLSRASADQTSLVGTLTVTGLDVPDQGGGWQPVSGALDPGRWAPANPTQPASESPVETVAAGLTVRYIAASEIKEIGAVTGTLATVPVVVTSAYAPPADTYALKLDAPSGPAVVVDVRQVAAVLPRVGDRGALVGLDQLLSSRSGGYPDLLPNEVWLSAAAPADFPARLRAAGVHVVAVDSAARRADVLAHQGPALAVVLLVASAAVAALLAAAGAVVNMHLLARRRAFELAAMRILGLRRSSLAAAVAVEQALLAGFAIVLGVGLGAIGARLALASIPEYADTPAFPPLLVPVRPVLLLGLAVGFAVLLGLAVAASTGALLRAAVPTRLREAQA